VGIRGNRTDNFCKQHSGLGPGAFAAEENRGRRMAVSSGWNRTVGNVSRHPAARASSLALFLTGARASTLPIAVRSRKRCAGFLSFPDRAFCRIDDVASFEGQMKLISANAWNSSCKHSGRAS
jgi:hypothetical protein